MKKSCTTVFPRILNEQIEPEGDYTVKLSSISMVTPLCLALYNIITRRLISKYIVSYNAGFV